MIQITDPRAFRDWGSCRALRKWTIETTVLRTHLSPQHVISNNTVTVKVSTNMERQTAWPETAKSTVQCLQNQDMADDAFGIAPHPGSWAIAGSTGTASDGIRETGEIIVRTRPPTTQRFRKPTAKPAKQAAAPPIRPIPVNHRKQSHAGLSGHHQGKLAKINACRVLDCSLPWHLPKRSRQSRHPG